MPFDPYAPPRAAGGPGAWSSGGARLDGEDLVLERGATLPAVCIKCGTHEGVAHQPKKFQWTPLWARLSIVFCTIGGIIAMLVTQKKAELSLPLCGGCAHRWNQARTGTIVGVVVLLVLIFGARVSEEPAVFGIGALLGIGGFIALSMIFVRPRVLTVQKIDDATVRLRGFSPEAARAFTAS